MKRLSHLYVLLPFMLLGACHGKPTLFESIPSSHSGIHFNNVITETDSINPMDVVNIYNGGGVGIGDFNNDGLQDIYFGGNQVPGKLYLNKGNFSFEDITDKAGVGGMGRWARGISVVDINNDGLMDIYICNTIYKDPQRRRNILYVNQGMDKEGVPHFKDMAAAYGLDMHGQSTMASFFDYDNDGDLDMYLTVNEASNGEKFSTFLRRNDLNIAASVGKLYRNDMDSSLRHPVFHDVSDAAGIKYEGFGHAASVCDINNDGWKDIYVSDDFLSNNILYINNHDGTFTNRLKDYFKHTSFNSMGQDVVDINNDGLPDVIELDMNPEDNYRKKKMLASDTYLTYQNFDSYGYEYQYVRNTLQINQGPRVGENDSIGAPLFSDIGFMSGISQTDWSWSPMVIDLDNDGLRDLIVTNGFPRDVSDHDFMAYREEHKGMASKKELLGQIPQVKLHNYAFKNKGDLTFSDESAGWGLMKPTFSNGIAYADLDNDGDLDMVINNINDEALVYRNTMREKDTAKTHFLQIRFRGGRENVNGLGAIADIYYDHGKRQTYENNPYRGYLSTMQDVAHFGLGGVKTVDSVVVRWSDGRQQTMRNIGANQVLTVSLADAVGPCLLHQPAVASDALLREITREAGVTYRHHDYDFIDFDIQHLLPHKLSEYCPALAVADLDGNGQDDLVIGGNGVYATHVLLQQADGRFVQQDSLPGTIFHSKVAKDEGILLFDANGDGKQDIYIASGGYELAPGDEGYRDRLYINDGKGHFNQDTLALPRDHTSKFCVRAMDYNHDGKLDLFVSGRVDPWNYPRPVSSCILRNDSEHGKARFTDVTEEVAPALKNIGMVCDALFTDFDGDGQTDLIVVGEWMPVTFLRNVGGRFSNVTAATGAGGLSGWWNSIAAGDFRHTGRTDYIVGNVGLNTLYQASDEYPVYMTAGDLDGNGRTVGVPSLFLPDRNGVKKEFPAAGRDDMTRQINSLKRRFPNYRSFAEATLEQVLTPEQRKRALRWKANMLQSCYLRNDGGGKFTAIPLPNEAQASTINGMVVEDFDGDGNLDVLINGNDFGTSIGIGRYDAFNGLLLKGDGAGGFKPLTMLQSGICIPGNGRALVTLRGAKGGCLVAASQNKGDLRLFAENGRRKAVIAQADDVTAIISFRDGRQEKKELYYGSSFLSQSTRAIMSSDNVKSIEIINAKGVHRTVTP
ncbi:VCBS repeat-containing protein [Flavitalea sp. BT771]|uniref:VCBS repeat-containing protein n=1 Tax=Flavitalea sp. BT771 TaxID=3063329 RepID=UPI0026E475FF|nr:VCBS repeat-containing protein [Flavitalea sp. BT771]MDO6429014.1 VCBS repeat-containing protein [Flavitalea sp. BT771]MDV6218858.1 VCBS repeat-containing protein [Flavitalea sp. BT771]